MYPYGTHENDTRVPTADDGSSPAVTLSQGFPYFGALEDTLYVCGCSFCHQNSSKPNTCISQVNTNGILSFRAPFTSFSPHPFPLGELPLIAPFWDDVDITVGGEILYRETQDPKLLQQFTQELINTTGISSYQPTYLFIATWVDVPPFYSETVKFITYICI